MGFLDSHTLTIKCPKCSAKHEKLIAWLKSNNKIACRCGTTIDLESDQFRRAIRESDDAVRRLQKTLKNL